MIINKSINNGEDLLQHFDIDSLKMVALIYFIVSEINILIKFR